MIIIYLVNWGIKITKWIKESKNANFQFFFKAVKNCSKAIELNPEYLKAILRRAEIYEETDKLGKRQNWSTASPKRGILNEQTMTFGNDVINVWT